MGLADFLVQAGRGTSAANIGAALGGNGGKTLRDSFIEDQLPALAQEIQANTDETKMPGLQMKFIQGALKAGIPPQSIDKMSEMLVKPHLEGMRQDQLDKLRSDYAGQPAQPAQPRPQGTEGPLTQSGNFVDPRAATPDKPLDLNFAMRLGQITGGKTEDFNKLIQTPADLAAKQASTAKTQGEIDKETVAARQRQGLPNVPAAPGQPSMQDVGVLAPGGLANFPQRDKQEDPLLEERRALLAAQTGAANSLAGLRATQGAGGGAGGQATTTSERVVNPTMQAEAGRKIAAAARDRGMTNPEQIRQIADEFGYTIEGNPQIDTGLFSIHSLAGDPTLTGTFRMTPKDTTKTTTKGAGASAGQGRYSQGVPSGSAPTPQAGGKGQAPKTPKRMKFDAQGNQIQ